MANVIFDPTSPDEQSYTATADGRWVVALRGGQGGVIGIRPRFADGSLGDPLANTDRSSGATELRFILELEKGDVVSTRIGGPGGPVAGGFNGGGDAGPATSPRYPVYKGTDASGKPKYDFVPYPFAYTSGGGGGCTRFFLNGALIAVAAGGGGATPTLRTTAFPPGHSWPNEEWDPLPNWSYFLGPAVIFEAVYHIDNEVVVPAFFGGGWADAGWQPKDASLSYGMSIVADIDPIFFEGGKVFRDQIGTRLWIINPFSGFELFRPLGGVSQPHIHGGNATPTAAGLGGTSDFEGAPGEPGAPFQGGRGGAGGVSGLWSYGGGGGGGGIFGGGGGAGFGQIQTLADYYYEPFMCPGVGGGGASWWDPGLLPTSEGGSVAAFGFPPSNSSSFGEASMSSAGFTGGTGWSVGHIQVQ